MNPIVKVLMKRDNMSEVEAIELFKEAKEDFDSLLKEGDLDSAYDICETYFGLEPDYIDWMY
jgi:hypothetical protein